MAQKKKKLKNKAKPKRRQRGKHLTPLMWACVDADLAEVKRLLARGADPNEATKDSGVEYQLVHVSFTIPDAGRTALMIASGDLGTANLAIMRVLLAAGAKADTSSEQGTPLSDAARAGSIPAMELLIEHGADVNQKAMFTPLFNAASEGHLEAVRFLLERGAAVDAPIWTGDTPLMTVKDAAIASLLLARGADPNARGRRNTTALIEAIQRSSPLALVEVLLGAGANPSLENDEKETPLVLAAGLDDSDVVECLLRAGVKPDDRSLLRASEIDRIDAAIALLDAGANIEARDDEGCTPLLLAAQNGYVDLGCVLIARGATVDPEARTRAKKNRRDEFVCMLDGDVVKAETLPKTVIAICQGAEALYEEQKYAEALAAYEALPSDFRDRIFAAVSNRGYCHQQLGHVTESLACFERALALDPDATHLVKGLCYAHYEAKRWKEMEQCALRLTKLTPKDSWCWQQLAIARGEREDFRGAVEAGKRALALDRKNAYAMFNLANMEKKLGLKAYRARYARALALAPELASSLDEDDRDLVKQKKHKRR